MDVPKLGRDGRRRQEGVAPRVRGSRGSPVVVVQGAKALTASNRRTVGQDFTRAGTPFDRFQG